MEPTLEEQAQMAVALDDKVRELVRKHMLDALHDAEFMDSVHAYHLTTAVTRYISTDYNFQIAVKQVMVSQMQK